MFQENCNDGSDELDCPNCEALGQFNCGGGTCIPKEKVCDQNYDCKNRQDESQCPGGGQNQTESTNDCLNGNDENCPDCDALDQFECEIGRCVPHENVCDGMVDCQNGQDEADCGDNDSEENDFEDEFIDITTTVIPILESGITYIVIITVWKLQKFTLTYLRQKFRESKVFRTAFTKEVTKRVNFTKYSFFPR